MVFSFYDITESESLLKYNTKPQVIAVIAIPNTFKIRLTSWNLHLRLNRMALKERNFLFLGVFGDPKA
jgi:hypothetical protein